MKDIFRYIMVGLYLVTGVTHFLRPYMYRTIMPPWVPFPMPAVYLSGVCEILFALMLLNSSTQSIGAWCLIVLLVAVFPANVQMAMDFSQKHNPYLWIAILRLPLQAVLIWWAWLYTR